MYGAVETASWHPSEAGSLPPLSPPPKPRRRRAAARAVAWLALSLAGLALLALAATTTNPVAGAAVALSNVWPGLHQYNTSFACVWHEPHHSLVHGLAIGHYVCYNTTAEAHNASVGREMVFDINGDDDDFQTPFKWDCAVIDDDSVFNEARRPRTSFISPLLLLLRACPVVISRTVKTAIVTPRCVLSTRQDICMKSDYVACWEADTTSSLYCGNGSDCFDWCGGACENGWWSYCLWDVVAHAPEACNGTYDPSPPSRRLRMGSGASCAQHSYCAPCGDDNEYCNSAYSSIRGTKNDTKNSMQGAINFLTPSTMEDWCGAWGLPYRNRSQAGEPAVASDHMPNVTDIKDVSKPACPTGTSGSFCQ